MRRPFYTQFDTHRRVGDFASFCGANKIIYLDLKATQVLAKCAVGTSCFVNTGLCTQVYTHSLIRYGDADQLHHTDILLWFVKNWENLTEIITLSEFVVFKVKRYCLTSEKLLRMSECAVNLDKFKKHNCQKNRKTPLAYYLLRTGVKTKKSRWTGHLQAPFMFEQTRLISENIGGCNLLGTNVNAFLVFAKIIFSPPKASKMITGFK